MLNANFIRKMILAKVTSLNKILILVKINFPPVAQINKDGIVPMPKASIAKAA